MHFFTLPQSKNNQTFTEEFFLTEVTLQQKQQDWPAIECLEKNRISADVNLLFRTAVFVFAGHSSKFISIIFPYICKIFWMA